jgi:hypothetical protein
MFQSTPPAWGATRHLGTDRDGSKFQSTPPAWGATSKRRPTQRPPKVSIHAPRVGGDSAWRNRLHVLEISCHNCELSIPHTCLKRGAKAK